MPISRNNQLNAAV